MESKQKELAELQHTALGEADTLLSLTKKQGNLNDDVLWYLMNTKMAACVKSRNEVLSTGIKEDYERVVKEMGRNVLVKPLKVFCVSASHFLEYTKDGDDTTRFWGFPTKMSTEIPLLREWLISTSFEARANKAQSFLEDLEGYELVLKRWASDSTVDARLDSIHRSRAEGVFELKLNELDQVCAPISLLAIIAEKHSTSDLHT